MKIFFCYSYTAAIKYTRPCMINRIWGQNNYDIR